LNDLVQKIKELLRGRRGSYRRVFNRDSADVQVVLVDLARFCRANVSTAHPDTHMAARLDGRREVWLRIQQHINLDTETLWLLYGGPKTEKGE
jgi:hypothetical protein